MKPHSIISCLNVFLVLSKVRQNYIPPKEGHSVFSDTQPRQTKVHPGEISSHIASLKANIYWRT